MSARTILTTAARRDIDLLAPKPEDYAGFQWVAEHLAKEKRFNGATPGEEYSVAEHLVRGADAVLASTGDHELAARFLLHDTPEGALKDDTTPKKCALAELAAEKFGILAEHIMACFDDLTARHDQAIHAAAGLSWPTPEHYKPQIKKFDLIMFVTEWRDLMADAVHPNWAPYSGIVPLREVISPWRWQTARDAYLRRCEMLLPAMQRVNA